jgi:prepilin signal peptidase PulO-like enzyme (type II secretory pathway)
MTSTSDRELRERATCVLAAVVAAALGLVVLLGFATLFNLYPGTRSGWFGPKERPAVADVGSCRRIGPISGDGFGYWWTCEVTVRTDDGRVVETVVRRSIVTPADRGAKVAFRESCKRDGFKQCSYGRPVARGWKAAMAVFQMVEWTVVIAFGFAVVLFLVRGLLGRRGYARLYDKLGWRPRALPRH